MAAYQDGELQRGQLVMIASGSNSGKCGHLARRLMPGDEFEHPFYRLGALPRYGASIPGWLVIGESLRAFQKPDDRWSKIDKLNNGFCVVPDHRVYRLTCTPEERKIFRRELRDHNERGEGAGYAYFNRRVRRDDDGEEA